MIRPTALILSAALASGCSPELATPDRPAPAAADPAAPPKAKIDISPAKRPPLAAPSRLLDRPRTALELPTTPWPIYIRNVRGQVESSAGAAKGGQPLALQLHGEKLLTYGRLMGDLATLKAALDTLSRAVEARPKDPRPLVLRAQANFSLHRWQALAADLTAAEALLKGRPAPMALRQLQAETLWRRGEVEAATAAFTEIAKARPSLYTLARLGHVLALRRGFEAGDKAYARAETLYKDVSPVPVAWLYTQRALLRIRHGRFQAARRFLEAAYARAPGYPMVVEHLAQIMALTGDLERAATLYREAIALSDHPEYHGALAGVLRAQARGEAADQEAALAQAGAEAAMRATPAAAAGHGVSLLRGLALAEAVAALEAQAKIGPEPELLAQLAEALVEADRATEALAILAPALDEGWRLPELYWIAARAARLIPARRGEARGLLEKAKALNPEIERLKGPVPL